MQADSLILDADLLSGIQSLDSQEARFVLEAPKPLFVQSSSSRTNEFLEPLSNVSRNPNKEITDAACQLYAWRHDGHDYIRNGFFMSSIRECLPSLPRQNLFEEESILNSVSCFTPTGDKRT